MHRDVLPVSYAHATPDGQEFYLGDCRDVLASLPERSVQTVVTSPPYYSLRKYAGVEGSIWLGDRGRTDCEHEWTGWTTLARKEASASADAGTFRNGKAYLDHKADQHPASGQ